MAFTLGDAIVRIIGKDELDKTLAGAKAKVSNFGATMKSTITNAFGTALKVGGAAIVGTVLAVGTAMLSTENQFRTSTNAIQSALGLTDEAAQGVGQSMRDVWANNFGESIKDVEQSIIAVEGALQRVGGVSNDQLTASTEDAIRLRDAYGIEVSESISQVATLMDQFGLTADQAFDFITSGMQDGLNSNDDFLDSIGEYSNLFAEAGFSAEEMYAIMETGAQGGVLGTDKVADAIKEMNIILNEGGAEVSDTFASMGMNFEGMQANVRSGKATWADYFPAILEGLQNIDDPIERNLAQTALFGTMAEDLGVSFTDSLSTMTTSLEDMAGATDELDEMYKNWGDTLEGWKRTALTAMKPLSDELLNMAEDALPDVQAAFEGLIEQLIVALPDIIAFVQELVDFAINWGPTIVRAIGFITAGLAILSSGFSGMTAIWNANWGVITETVETARAAIELAATMLMNFLLGKWNEHKATLLPIVIELWSGIETLFTEVPEKIRQLITDFRTGMEGDWSDFKTTLIDLTETIILGLVDIFGTLWPLVKPVLDTAISNAKSALIDAGWNAVGGDIIAGVVNGINGSSGSLFSTLKGLAEGALNAAKGALGIQSPSRLFMEQVGEPIVQGVEQPLIDGRSRVVRAIENLVAIPAGLQGGGGSVNNTTNNIGGDIFNLVTNSPASIANFVSRNKRAELQGILGF